MTGFRTIMGVFFGLLGLILVGTGMAAPELRAPLAQTNVNLAAGTMMLAFGGILLWLSRRRV